MKTNNIITVGTHNGIFHQDEVVTVALLSILHDNKIVVKRTRDINILCACDYVVDVGGGDFDHHMSGGNGIRKNTTPYASAGLVWKRFSKEILTIYNCPEKLICDISERIDENIIEDVDKIDNGILAHSLFDFVPLYIPNWDEDFNKVDKSFNQALTLTIQILSTAIQKEIASARSCMLLEELIENNNSHVLEIPSQYIDWKTSVIKANNTKYTSIDFVIFPYPNGGYAAQAVPPSINEPFKQRVPFPKEWAGLTTTLPKVSGIDTATFCHNNLFFARADTKEDVIKLCDIAISKS